MRVIAGSLGGRNFEAPKGHKTHPMSEKMRGALFNILGDIEGLTILDAFAGSGAIAIEAVSRGAKSAVAADVSKEACAAIKQNVTRLGLENTIKVVRANTSGWSDNNPKARFDIVVADPPYEDIQLVLLQKITRHVKKNGLFVVSLPPTTLAEFKTCEHIAMKEYGDSKLLILKKLID